MEQRGCGHAALDVLALDPLDRKRIEKDPRRQVARLQREMVEEVRGWPVRPAPELKMRPAPAGAGRCDL